MGRKKLDEKDLKKHTTFRIRECDLELLKKHGNGSRQKGIDLLINSLKKKLCNK